MDSIRFTIAINAPKEKVWKVLWEDATYRKWTSAFSEGSYAVSDWKEGSRVHFLTPAGEGMYSTIAVKRDNELMSFRHLGVIKDGKELPVEKSQQWHGAMENYTLSEQDHGTLLTVEVDVMKEYLDYMQETFPKALQKLKTLAEE